MKKLFTNLVVFAALSVAFSNLTACNTASSEKKGPNVEVGSNGVTVSSNSTDATVKNGDFPPVPSGIIQAQITDLDGKIYTLEEKKGKVMLVNLWATWCGPCRQEMPHLVEMQTKYKDKDFEVIGLNADDESPDAIKSFGENMKLNYALGVPEEKLITEMMRLSRQQGIPQSILINREGKTVGVFFGSGPKAINGMKELVEKSVN